MAKPNSLWIARTRLHRLVRWIDGVETEFALPFDKLSDSEKLMIVGILKSLTDELDDYYDNDGMRSAACVVNAHMEESIKIVEIKEPRVN